MEADALENSVDTDVIEVLTAEGIFYFISALNLSKF